MYFLVGTCHTEPTKELTWKVQGDEACLDTLRLGDALPCLGFCLSFWWAATKE